MIGEVMRSVHIRPRKTTILEVGTGTGNLQSLAPEVGSVVSDSQSKWFKSLALSGEDVQTMHQCTSPRRHVLCLPQVNIVVGTSAP